MREKLGLHCDVISGYAFSTSDWKEDGIPVVKIGNIVLNDSDSQYYKTTPSEPIGAKVYSLDGQTSYTLFWTRYEKALQTQIDEIGDPTRAIHQIKEKSIVQRILLDLPEFFEFIKDAKGISLPQHIDNGFCDIAKFMEL